MNEEDFMNQVEKYCQESLSPDIYEKWVEVKYWLGKNRKELKNPPSSTQEGFNENNDS